LAAMLKNEHIQRRQEARRSHRTHFDVRKHVRIPQRSFSILSLR
jgi:hypothetical protein